jgi:hypothetical protein
LLANRLCRTSVTVSGDIFVHLRHMDHQKVDMPECGGEVMVTKISAVCGSDIRPTVFYHMNPVGAESRGILSWNGKTLTNTQGVLEVIIRNFLSQQVVA